MTRCDNCPCLSTGCGFIWIGGVPYCQREINGKTISTNMTKVEASSSSEEGRDE